MTESSQIHPGASAPEPAEAEPAATADAQRQRDAVVRLLEGRPGTDLLLVSVIASAVEYGSTPYDDLPMTLTWNGSINLPDGGRRQGPAAVRCATPYGGRAHLVLDGSEREALASLLELEVRGVNAPCETEGCRQDHDWDPSDPNLVGWSRLEIAVLGDGPRWYCSDMCVFDALARAGHDLAADDQAAAVDPDEQGHDLDERYGPGASDEYVLQMAEATEAMFDDERGDTGEDGAL